MKAKLAETTEEIEKIVPVMRELRPQYSAAELTAQIHKQRELGYMLAYVEDKGQILSVAGFVVGEKLAWQKHVYVDDLVTSETQRSTGAGKCLMDWLKDYAIAQGCQQLHLDSGVQRFSAHKFYLREGFVINSHHFAIPDLT